MYIVIYNVTIVIFTSSHLVDNPFSYKFSNDVLLCTIEVIPVSCCDCKCSLSVFLKLQGFSDKHKVCSQQKHGLKYQHNYVVS